MATGKERTIYHLAYTSVAFKQKKTRALSCTKEQENDFVISLFTPMVELNRVSELWHTKEFGSFIPFNTSKNEISNSGGAWLFSLCYIVVPWIFILHNLEHILWFWLFFPLFFRCLQSSMRHFSTTSTLRCTFISWLSSCVYNCNLLKYFQSFEGTNNSKSKTKQEQPQQSHSRIFVNTLRLNARHSWDIGSMCRHSPHTKPVVVSNKMTKKMM